MEHWERDQLVVLELEMNVESDSAWQIITVKWSTSTRYTMAEEEASAPAYLTNNPILPSGVGDDSADV